MIRMREGGNHRNEKARPPAQALNQHAENVKKPEGKKPDGKPVVKEQKTAQKSEVKTQVKSETKTQNEVPLNAQVKSETKTQNEVPLNGNGQNKNAEQKIMGKSGEEGVVYKKESQN